jgi:hypothetical protein
MGPGNPRTGYRVLGTPGTWERDDDSRGEKYDDDCSVACALSEECG